MKNSNPANPVVRYTLTKDDHNCSISGYKTTNITCALGSNFQMHMYVCIAAAAAIELIETETAYEEDDNKRNNNKNKWRHHSIPNSTIRSTQAIHMQGVSEISRSRTTHTQNLTSQ